MHFYPFHIGDYAARTRFFTLMQDLAFRRMLDLYYQSEKPLPADPKMVAMKIGMGEHADDVAFVLSEMFLKSESESGLCFRSNRCEKEISKYHGKAERAKQANAAKIKAKNALKSETKSDQESGENTERNHDATKNQEPRTKNSLSESKERKRSARTQGGDDFDAKGWLQAEGVGDKVASDWLKVRKTKKAPNTETAFAKLKAEAEKAGISVARAVQIAAEKSWIGFDASWNWPGKPEDAQSDIFAPANTTRERGKTLKSGQPGRFEQMDSADYDDGRDQIEPFSY